MRKLDLPKGLQIVIGEEKIDFSVFARRKSPISLSFTGIGISLFFLIIPSFAAYTFFSPLFKDERVNIWDNLEGLILPFLILSLFIGIGIGLLIWGLIVFFKNGGYYVGTENRLINYAGGTIKYYDWGQFTGNVELNFKKKDISLEMRRGKMRRRENGTEEFEPEWLYLSGIDNIIEVEKICRKRIKENDPTQVIKQII